MTEKCNSYFDGYFFGYMCRRKSRHTGRHLWWIGGVNTKAVIYWFEGRNSWAKMFPNKRVEA